MTFIEWMGLTIFVIAGYRQYKKQEYPLDRLVNKTWQKVKKRFKRRHN